MCGIAGLYHLDGAPVDVSVLKRMTDAQRHRGPDDQGVRLFSLSSGTSSPWSKGAPPSTGIFEGALGFNRLSILDLSDHGHQPMVSADGKTILAFNGEIYNAFDHRAELENAGFRFRSQTDTEIILYLYERHGLEGMLSRLNGMFVIVIVDLQKGEIQIARDPMGIKPLYWTIAGRTVLFASEAKAFLHHPEFRAEVAVDHLDEHLAFRYVAGANTLLKGVRQLRPGHCLRIARNEVDARRYWRLPDADRQSLSDEEAESRVSDLLRAAVKSQLLSDVPVGCQLSGGIDSSLVCVYACSHFATDMQTFSVVFDDEAYSEEPWIDEAARAAKAVSHRFKFTGDFFLDTINKASWHLDQPLSHPNSLGIWLLAAHSRERVTVLLSGEGADEVFGGYTRAYYANLRTRLAPWAPLLRRIPGIGARLNRQFGGDAIDSFIGASLWLQPNQLRELRPSADFESAMEPRRALFAEGASDHLSNCMQYDMQTYLVDLLVRQDKMTMAHSVENRVPFLDLNLVNGSRWLPARSLVSPSIALRNARMRGTKVVLKKLASKIFGERFAYRRKSGFPLPLHDYFASKRFESLMEDRLLPGMAQRGLVQADVVRRWWKSLPAGDVGTCEALWIPVALEIWAQQFLDARPGDAVLAS